jgi:hypothetical protein
MKSSGVRDLRKLWFSAQLAASTDCSPFGAERIEASRDAGEH